MRIITRKRLNDAVALHARLSPTINHWYAVAKRATWRNLPETRKSFPHADQVKVKSGKLVTVFNLTNDFRLITAIHYNRQIIYILRIMTHAEYDGSNWKQTL